MTGELVRDNSIRGEVVEPMNAADAGRLDQRIRLLIGDINNKLEKLYELVEQAKRGGLHEALGFASWTAYVTDVFSMQGRLERTRRQELVCWLSDEGMSQRAIADVVGAGIGTVNRDLAAGVPNGTPNTAIFSDEQEAADCITMAELADNEFEAILTESRTQGDLSREDVAQRCREHLGEPPRSTTGRDGKTYQRKPPQPQREPEGQPRRKPPLIDQARGIAVNLDRINKRLAKLMEDDRFGRNRDAIGCRIRPHVDDALKILGRLDREINGGKNSASDKLYAITQLLQACLETAARVDYSEVGQRQKVQYKATIRDLLDGIALQVDPGATTSTMTVVAGDGRGDG